MRAVRRILILVLASASLGDVFAQEPSPPKIASSVSPIIPYMAVYSRASGPVIAEASINSKGQVSDARILQGHPPLRNATREALRHWRFQSKAATKQRLVQLIFNYPEIQRGEKAISISVLPYGIELVTDVPSRSVLPAVMNFIPDNWVPGEDRCKVHRTISRKDRVPYIYGLIGFREGYTEARSKYFPNSNLSESGGCVVETTIHIDSQTGKQTTVTPREADVLYCSRCRRAERVWGAEKQAQKVQCFLSQTD